MAVEKNSLMKALVQPDISPEKGRVDFETAMQKMEFTSVFDIIRLSQSEFAQRLMRYSDADPDLAYKNATRYAALIGRLYREYKTSSGKPQQSAQRTGILSLTSGPIYQNEFKEDWDSFVKVGAMAAIDSPVAYLAALWVFIKKLEATRHDPNDPIDPKRILLDKRRPDLKDLLITRENTFTPRPMLEIVNDALTRNLLNYLKGIEADKGKPIHQVLSERRFPFDLPYNFYHHQCQLGLADKKPGLGELNYWASLLLPIEQAASNHYGKVQTPARQAQLLLSGLSPQQQKLLIERSPFSNFYLTRSDLTDGWKSAGTTHLSPHNALRIAYLLPSGQDDIDKVDPAADKPDDVYDGTNNASVIFRKTGQSETKTLELAFNSMALNESARWNLNYLHENETRTIVSSIKATVPLPDPGPDTDGYTARFDLYTATGMSIDTPVKLAKQSFTLTLDETYDLTTQEKAWLKQSYGVDVSNSPLWQMSELGDFMHRTGLNAEQVESLVCRQRYAVRLSPNCSSSNPQHAGVTLPESPDKVLPFPHPSHYGACYVNGTGTGADLYDSVTAPTPESKIRDQFDNAMDLVQVDQGDKKYWHLTKTSLYRLDRLQRMVRLQRCTGIPFNHLDTLISSVIRSEGEHNLGMELNENTLRALGVYRYLNQRYAIGPEEFAALMHYLTPWACGEGAVPLFDQVFNRVQMFDAPLILDQSVIKLDGADVATQKTLLQLCAGLRLQPTEDSLLLVVEQTKKHLGELKRDLATVSSLYRQARIAQLFGYSVAELLTLAGLLGGRMYKTILASGRVSPRATPDTPDILDVLMQLVWAVDWLKDSQQTVAQLQARLGPNVPLAATDEPEDNSSAAVFEHPPLSDDLLKRLIKLQDDTRRSVVTWEQVAALGLPTHDDDTPNPNELKWFELLGGKDPRLKDDTTLLSRSESSSNLIDKTGLLIGLDRSLALVDEPLIWLGAGVDTLLKYLELTDAVKQTCKDKLVGLLLNAYGKQVQLLEGLFQETAKLPSERVVAVIHWADSSVYSILVDALDAEANPALIEHFQRVSQHAEIVVHLRLSDNALRLFLVNPSWLGSDQYSKSNSEPSLADLYLFERFSRWLHTQSEPEDTVLSYFSLANPPEAKLKNKALRKVASETANGALARLLEWSETEVATLTDELPKKRACSMAQVDWVRRCQATCEASGLSAMSLLQATDLSVDSPLNAWKDVGNAVMANAHSSRASV